jgi:hypothetical protein
MEGERNGFFIDPSTLLYAKKKSRIRTRPLSANPYMAKNSSDGSPMEQIIEANVNCDVMEPYLL